MRKNRWSRQVIVVGILLVASSFASVKAEPQPLRPVSEPLKVTDIIMPEDLGYVVEAHPATRLIPHQIVVHIQEAHTNYEAQQHLIGILEELIKNFGLSLILVEGGEGDVSMSYLREYGPPDNRRQVAEKYLRSGIISGEEYLDIVSDYPLTLWGVEQKTLYEENLDAFLAVEGLERSLLPTLVLVQQAIDSLTPQLADPALIEFDTKAQAFDAGALSLGEYVEFLWVEARRNRIDTSEFSNVRALHVTRGLEQTIALDKISGEQQALIRHLGTIANPKGLEALIAQAAAIKDGTTTREAFYEQLEELAASSRVNLEPYPNLSRYMTYLKRSADLKPNALAEEIDTLTARLRDAMASTPASRRLMKITEELDLVEKLLALKLSPAEYRIVRGWRLEDIFSGWEQFLNEQMAAQNLPRRSLGRLDSLAQALGKQRAFYEVALKRDQVLVDNTLAKLQETREPLAVLITGGFHSSRITELLRGEGIGMVVLAPKVSEKTDKHLYEAVLKYKSGHGSLDEVMKLADEAAPLARQ